MCCAFGPSDRRCLLCFFLFAFYWLAKDDDDDTLDVVYMVNDTNMLLDEVHPKAFIRDIIAKGHRMYGLQNITFDEINIKYTTPGTDFALRVGGDVLVVRVFGF